MIFAYSDIVGDIQEQLAEHMGVDPNSLPILMAMTPSDMKIFRSEKKP